ncbi:MAG: glycine cleavage system protein GcvH [Gammaproteobacteria bacterium]|nr:glycine cleavage system protein GcvH [Gammaproteobacteria bacterium]
MPDFPSDLRYALTHEWVRVNGKRATVGISDYAQTQLGDVVYVELPEIGTPVECEGEVAVVESVKAASDIYAPVTGKIVDTNNDLENAPETVNADPYGEGWFFVIDMSDEELPEDLLTAEAYSAHCQDEDDE